MKHLKERKENCFGCGGCVSLCPLQIVSLQQDEEGFFYSVYDEDACIGCKKCLKACPGFDGLETSEEREVFALRHKDREQLEKSTSGAVFALLAQAVVGSGGAVVGARFDEEFHVVHDFANSMEAIEPLRTSKYVQSDMLKHSVYENILKQIETQQVLFTGTPCQVDSVRRYVRAMGGNEENLILCDLICSKASSPGIWGEYISYLERECKGRLTAFSFRDKKYGWNFARSTAKIGGKDRSGYVDAKCSWIELLTKSSFCRPSCYDCPFTRVERNADLTIGDFWGIEKSIKRFADEKGVNVVIAQTPKGKAILEEILPYVDVVRSDAVACRQDRLCFPTKRPENRDEFWKVYQTQGMDGLIEKFGRRGFVKRTLYGKLLPFARKIKIYDLLWKIYHR